MNSNFISLSRLTGSLVAAGVLLFFHLSVFSQSLVHYWTKTGTGTIRNLQNMAVVSSNGDRFVVEETGSGISAGWNLVRYNLSGDVVWRRPYVTSTDIIANVPFAVTYANSAIYVLCRSQDFKVNVVKYNLSGVKQWVSVFGTSLLTHYPMGIVADPVSTGIIFTSVTHVYSYETLDYSNRMTTTKVSETGGAMWSRDYELGPQTGLPRPSPKTITADDAGDIYVSGVMDCARMIPYNEFYVTNSTHFTVKYSTAGTFQWERKFSAPGVTQYAYDNDYDATGVYVLGQSTPVHYTNATPRLTTATTTLTKLRNDGTTAWTRAIPSRIREFRNVLGTYRQIEREALAVDRTTTSVYVAYDAETANTVNLEKYNSAGVILWSRSVTVGDSTCIQSVKVDRDGNVLVGVNNGSYGSTYTLYAFTFAGRAIGNLSFPNKRITQINTDDLRFIHVAGIMLPATTNFASRFSFAPSYPLTPDLLEPVEGLNVDLFGFDPDWCWTNFKIDWRCFMPPFCGAPDFSAAMFSNNKTVWESKFSKPSDFQLPQTQEFRTFALSMKNGNAYSKVITLDDKLVKNGVKHISMTPDPTTQAMTLSIGTTGASVPVTLTLFNKNGKAIWETKLVAPIQKLLTDKVKEPVAYMALSGAAEVMSFSYYPNPSNGSFNVALDKSVKLPAELTIYDMQGFKIQGLTLKDYTVPVTIPGSKAGLYVLQVRSNLGERRETIQVK